VDNCTCNLASNQVSRFEEFKWELIIEPPASTITVSRRPGHSRVFITHETYSHLILELLSEAVDLNDELVTTTLVKVHEPITIE
jgi:hypothetical protein